MSLFANGALCPCQHDPVTRSTTTVKAKMPNRAMVARSIGGNLSGSLICDTEAHCLFLRGYHVHPHFFSAREQRTNSVL